MGSDKVKAYGGEKREEHLWMNPDKLTIVGAAGTEGAGEYDTADGPEHPLYDERAKWAPRQNLVDDMVKNGWDDTSAITIRKAGERADKTPIVEIVAGRGRTKAARVASKIRVAQGLPPLLVRVLTMRGEAVNVMGSMIRENSKRMNDNIVVEARKMARYIKLIGGDEKTAIEECATAFGVVVPTVKNRLQILDCHPDVIEAFAKQLLPVGMAKDFVPLSHEEQLKHLKESLAKAKVSPTVDGPLLMSREDMRDVREKVKKAKGARGKTRANRGHARGRKAWDLLHIGVVNAEKMETKVKIGDIINWAMGDDDALVEYEWIRQILSPPRKGKKAAKAAE